MGKKLLLAIVFVNILSLASAQNLKNKWVDSVLQTLNTQEKIAQLFMIPVSGYATDDEKEDLIDLISKYQPGSLMITNGGPNSTVNIINQLQSKSRVPFLTAISAEWGLSQTLDSVTTFPKPLQLSSLQDNDLVYQLGKEIAREMKLLGLNINFAPNGDTNPKDLPYPQTMRYFGFSKERVASKSVSFMKGLQDENIIACAIHPATVALRNINRNDTSYYLPAPDIDTVSLFPYKKMFNEGLKGLLTPHMHASMINGKADISGQLFTINTLKKDYGFNGLFFADIPYLEELTGKDKDGEIEKLAIDIGNDILINPKNIQTAIKALVKAARSDKKFQVRLEESVRKIIETKYDAGLLRKNKINTDNLVAKLNSPSAKLLKQYISEQSPVVVSNEKNTIPIQHLENKKFISVSVGKELNNDFEKYLSKYASFEHLSVRSIQDTIGLYKKLQQADVIVFGLFPFSTGLMKDVAPLMYSISKKKDVITVHFGNPKEISYVEELPTLIVGTTDENGVPKIAAEIIFGGISSAGEMPVTVGKFYEGQNIKSKSLGRLVYAVPEEVDVDSKTLSEIEAIANEAIEIGATPGCNVLVAKNGKVIYERSFGWLTYENKAPVSDETIYDLASVTKVSATLQTVMFMYERGLIDINKKISVYLPELKDSNKKDFTIKDILTHQAGLWPYLPFWVETMKNGTQLPQYYSNARTEEYPFPVADGLFAHKSMKDSLWNWIIKAKVREKIPRTGFDYRYSDMGFYIMQHLAEKLLNQPIEDFLEQNLYEPLGAYELGYLPLLKFPTSMIAPTENDQLFRKNLLVGYVHDQGAAMHGGIAGHAGLFGSANDLAKLGQMLLQKGYYGGHQYYKPETIDLFTTKQFETSRRGLGWDKPTMSEWNGPTTNFASEKTFGHTGFTGTCIWVDPEFDLVFVFLSNRVHPDMNNNKLLNANIRPRIQEVIYKAIFNYCQY
jgi:CubicO group peptidase (beta-lactamase class C family)/beta-glucosidase-like glycosyl hydrolase